MSKKNGILQRYLAADKKDRVYIMIDNYAVFEELIEVELRGIAYQLKQVMATSEKYKGGFKECSLSDPYYDDVEGIEELRRSILIIKMMRMDFAVMEKQIAALRPSDRKLLERIYMDDVKLETIAEEEGTSYETSKTRVRRARGRLRDNMLDFWDRYQVYEF